MASNNLPGKLAALPAVPAAVVYVDPTAAAGGNGSLAHPFDSWNFSLRAGVTYLQRAGTTAQGTIQVASAGNAAAPLVIGAYGKGAAPVLAGTVDFSGASYATLRGFALSNANGAAVVIQQGSCHIDIDTDTITGSFAGVWIGNQAGGDITVHADSISGAADAGILIDETAGSAGNRIRITGNAVSGSGGDGIQVAANHVLVADNIISGNGLTMAGASGIQVYAASANAGTGQDNVITGNVVVGNHDFLDQDGNGILLDQWTSGNAVRDNFATGNDGAGIALYDSSRNTISGNVLGGDAADSGGTHAIHAEISLNQALGLTRGNVFSGNTALSFNAGSVAVSVTGGAEHGGNVFSGDVFENSAGGDVFQVGGSAGLSLSDWNKALGAADHFSGVALSRPAPSAGYGYSFAPNTTVLLDGHLDHLTGWSASGGLFGT